MEVLTLMIQRNSMISWYPLIQREFQLEVWTLIIQESTVIPSSSMVLLSTGKKYSKLGTRVVVPYNSHNKRVGLFFWSLAELLEKKRD